MLRRLQRACVILCTAVAATVLSGVTDGAWAEPRPLRLVALGDSLTAGYGLPEKAAFPAVLETALQAKGQDVRIGNAGVSGDTSTGGLARVDWSVPDGTDGVILELGANDMLRGVDPVVTKKALETIITRLRARNIPVLLAGMFASRNLGPDYVAKFEAMYRDLAQEHGLVLYPFFLDGVTEVEGMTLPDRLHPTAEGVKVIVNRILPSVETFLGRIQGAPKPG